MAGRSCATGAGFARMGVTFDETLKRFLIDVAAAAISGLSLVDGADKRAHAAPITPLGTFNPPRGKADPLCFFPTSIGGRMLPKLIADIGSSG